MSTNSEWKTTEKRTVVVWVDLREANPWSNDLMYRAGIVDWSAGQSSNCPTRVRITVEELPTEE